ncbi:MAG TPA: vWA domain-containing protein, partial [Bacteroidota bacterium]
MSVLPSIEFSFSSSPLYAALLILLGAGLSYFFYRFTLPPVTRPRRIVLSVLRGTALALVLILLLEPVLRTSFVIHHPPVVAILADRSASMTIVDRTGNRAEQIKNLLTSVIPGAIPAGVETEFYSFGTSLRGPLRQPLDTLGDETTDIAGAFLALGHERERFNIRAVIMLSDGMYTEGENPLYRAGGLGIPVFTVGVGDTAQQKDVLVSRITANDVVYAGTTAPVDVVIKSSGYGGEKAEVTLHDGPRILDRAVVVLPAGTAEVSARLSYTPEGEGSRRYTVRVSSLPGELTAANNRRLFGVKVLRSTMRVLILAAGPSPDLSIIRGTLAEDPNISVRALTQKLGGGYYEGVLTRQIIDSAD